MPSSLLDKLGINHGQRQSPVLMSLLLVAVTTPLKALLNNNGCSDIELQIICLDSFNPHKAEPLRVNQNSRLSNANICRYI